MEQIYIPYWEWEDWKHGMWNKLNEPEQSKMLTKAIEFTGNHILYGEAMRKVIIEWPKTMLNSLTNMSINRRAFLGHCACSLEFNCPEYITRMAWKELTDKQRILADNVAQETINKWELDYETENNRLHSGLGKQMLFRWDS